VFCLVNFCYWSGVNAVLPLVSIYTIDILGATPGEAQLLPSLLFLSTMLLAMPMAWLGTKLGKGPVLSAGFAIMGLAAVAGLLITSVPEGVALFFLAGIGNAAVVVLAIPLLADLVPRHHMGAASGFLAASGSIAAPLASVVAGSLSELYGPRVIFAVMAVMTAVAVGLMWFVRASPAPTRLTAVSAGEGEQARDKRQSHGDAGAERRPRGIQRSAALGDQDAAAQAAEV
jgi:MFS family permease